MNRSDINMNNIELFRVAGEPSQFVRDGRPQVAFSGRSNVGKSSLINTMMGRRALARVSSTPGKTITVNFYSIDKKLYFVDLPGYGYAKRSPSARARLSRIGDGYYGERLPCLTVQLIDSRIGPTKDDMIMLEFLSDTASPCCIAATKCDKLGTKALAESIASLERFGIPVVAFSSLKGTGRDELWNHILTAVSQ